MANTEYLNLTIYPEVAGVKQIDLRLSYLANAQIIDAFAKAMATKTAQLKEVAFSGSYDDLENRPDIPGTVPIATVEIAGKVKPDGETILIDEDGKIRTAANTGIATTEKPGVVMPDGVTITIDADGKIKATCEIATIEAAGIVKPDGTTITIDTDGTIHGRDSYTKAEVDDIMAELSELLTSDDELTVLGTALDTLMGETNEYSGLGGSLVELDSMADELIA